METIKKQIVLVNDSNGDLVEIGTKVIMLVDGKVLAGIFNGVTKRGSWSFNGIANFSDVTYNILPKSIKAMYIFE